MNGAADLVEAGAHIVLHREKAAQIERPFELDRDAFERDAERGRVSAVSDFLARGERRQYELDRVGAAVRSAEAWRFVDGDGKLADFGFAAQPFHLTRVSRKRSRSRDRG